MFIFFTFHTIPLSHQIARRFFKDRWHSQRSHLYNTVCKFTPYVQHKCTHSHTPSVTLMSHFIHCWSVIWSVWSTTCTLRIGPTHTHTHTQCCHSFQVNIEIPTRYIHQGRTCLVPHPYTLSLTHLLSVDPPNRCPYTSPFSLSDIRTHLATFPHKVKHLVSVPPTRPQAPSHSHTQHTEAVAVSTFTTRSRSRRDWYPGPVLFTRQEL